MPTHPGFVRPLVGLGQPRDWGNHGIGATTGGLPLQENETALRLPSDSFKIQGAGFWDCQLLAGIVGEGIPYHIRGYRSDII